MNKRIGSIYVAVKDNEVIAYETNLKLFVELVSQISPKARNYDWFYRSFEKSIRFSTLIGEDEYHFQKLG